MTDEPVTVTQALLPCPFCGSENVTTVWTRVSDDAQWWNGKCNDCDAATNYKQNIAEAIIAWNTRAAMPSQNYDLADLIEKLCAMKPVYNGDAVPCGQEPVNPDGPEVAAEIIRLLALRQSPQDPAPIIADLLASALMPKDGWESARPTYCWERDGLDYLEHRKLSGDRPPINDWTAKLVDQGYPASNGGDKRGTPNPLQGKFWQPAAIRALAAKDAK